jgi:hypothetical protein
MTGKELYAVFAGSDTSWDRLPPTTQTAWDRLAVWMEARARAAVEQAIARREGAA